VGILGLTYKPGTDVVEQAAGTLLARELAARGVPVLVFDPAGPRNVCASLGEQARFTDTYKECISQAGVVVLATPWPEFLNIPAAEWARHDRPRTVVDCWRAVPHLMATEGVKYVSIGTGSSAFVGSRAISMGSKI
jgi:UDPglucose 6-dehydrogenase